MNSSDGVECRVDVIPTDQTETSINFSLSYISIYHLTYINKTIASAQQKHPAASQIHKEHIYTKKKHDGINNSPVRTSRQMYWISNLGLDEE